MNAQITQGVAAGAIVQPYARHAASLHVCHVISGDLWAGAEVQVATTVAYLAHQPGLSVSAVLFNEGQLADRLRGLRIPVTVIDEKRYGTVAILRQLATLFREIAPDVVHTHRYNDTVLATVAALLTGVPWSVRTVHGLREPLTGWKHLKFGLYEACDRAVLRARTDKVIAVSVGVAAELRRSGVSDTLITQIHNGIDLAAVAPAHHPDEVRKALGIQANALVVGTAGRLEAVKNHAALLRAGQIMLRERPDTVLLIVGDGSLAQELRHLAISLRIERSCIFTGGRADAYDLINAMDIFALPSLSEGIPMALLEAMALGVPVVASAAGGIREVVEQGVTGLLVTPGDARSLAAACLLLARDRAAPAGWLRGRDRLSRSPFRWSSADERCC